MPIHYLLSEQEIYVECPAGIRRDTGYCRYIVEPIKEGSVYLIVGYELSDGLTGMRYVDDENGMLKVVDSDDEEWIVGIPVSLWDGRKIDYNKSGNHKFTTTKKEAIDIAVSIVTYNNGTVTELPGVSVKSVKVDKKNQKKASVAFVDKAVSVNLLSRNAADNKLDPYTYTALEFDKINDLPYFQFSANIKGSEAKTYKKDVNKILKDKKFYYGIMQHPVNVNFGSDDYYWRLQDLITNVVLSGNLIGADGKEHPAYDTKEDGDQIKVTISDDTAPIEKALAEWVSDASYFDSDVESMIIDRGEMKISGFNGKKATVNLRGLVGDDIKGVKIDDLGKLKAKTDFTIDKTGSIAGTTVNILDFPAGGNYVYADYAWVGGTYDGTIDQLNIPGTVKYQPVAPTAFGYKYAFRKSPDEKSKKFRGGIYAADNAGFVFETE